MPDTPQVVPDLLLQRDDVCPAEKAAAIKAWALWSGRPPNRRTATLADVVQGVFIQAPGEHPPAVPIGTVEFCRAWMRSCGLHEPAPLDFPDALREFLGRRVQRLACYALAPDGAWVKPVRTKAWAAHRKGIDPTPEDLDPTGEVWASQPLQLQAEWRVYVLDTQVVGVGRYDDGEDALDARQNQAQVWAQQLARFWAAREVTPAAYALDVACTQDGRWVLVEVTDAWAMGYYRGSCTEQNYLRMLLRRWEDLVHDRFLA